MNDMINLDICFCMYTGYCPRRADCRRSMTDDERRQIGGALISVSDFRGMRENGLRCFLPREENK